MNRPGRIWTSQRNFIASRKIKKSMNMIPKQIMKSFFGALFMIGALSGNSQGQSLFLEAKTVDKGIEIIWIPTASGIWMDNFEDGYTLVRTELSADGTAGNELSLLSNSNPKDSLWFSQLDQSAHPILEPIGGLLYDTLFQFPPNDLLDEKEMKYNYIMEEVSNYFEIASALGLGYLDTLVEEGKRYRYEVNSVREGAYQSIEISNVYFEYKTAPEDLVLEFEHPNDLSLSQMYAKANPSPRSFIKAIGKSYGDSIVLRWGLNDAKLWETAKEEGFSILRSTDGRTYETVEVIKPWPEEAITEAISHDSMAMLAAGLLYGMNEHKTNDKSLYEQNSIFENNLGFALFAAERSPLAADILGFRYVDKNIEKDSTYIYLIGTEGIEDLWDAGKVTIYPGAEALKAPERLQSESLENSVKLTWSINENRERYSSYMIEKSMDGKSYQNITSAPLVFMETNGMRLLEYSFVDSVENYQKAYYRLYGYDSFGDKSPPAEVTGIAVDKTPPLPVDIAYTDYIRNEERIILEWDISEEQYSDISHYQVLLSDEKDGMFSAISEPLATTTVNYSFPIKGIDTNRAFYFKIASHDANGNVSESLPTLVVVPDLTAPEPPKVIAASLDSNSYVTIAWEHSTSSDVMGYWLYWSNDPEDEMTPVNVDILTDNSYTYYLDTETLTKKIYYCVRAQDRSYNKGRITDIVEVQRLDYNPPIPPYEFYGNNSSTNLSLNWKKSPSSDVAFQTLWRSVDEIEWIQIDSLLPFVESYLDVDSLEIGQTYSYYLQAIDNSGNISDNSKILTLDWPFNNEIALIEILSVKTINQEAHLTWNVQINEALDSYEYKIEIQRSSGGGPLRYFKTLSSEITDFSDSDIQANVLYNYAVRIRFDNGWVGDLSEIKSILVK